MDFSYCQCQKEEDLNGLQLVDELQNRMTQYPVAVIVVGASDQKREEFVKWLDARLQCGENFERKNVHILKNTEEVKDFSGGKPDEKKWIDIVNLSHDLVMDYSIRYEAVAKFDRRCGQVVMVWLRPSTEPHRLVSCAEGDIDKELAARRPILDGIKQLITLYF